MEQGATCLCQEKDIMHNDELLPVYKRVNTQISSFIHSTLLASKLDEF